MASSTQDSQVATAALKRYTQLWIFGSSEITIYIWSTATVTQIFLIGPALYKYCSKSKQEQQPTNNSDEKIVLFAVPATFYGIFLASFVALVSSNPFVFVIAAIVLLVNKLMFFIRCKLSATRSKYVSKSSEGAARKWSTVVDISISPPSFKHVSLSLSRSTLSETPKQVFFNPTNIFDTFAHSITTGT